MKLSELKAEQKRADALESAKERAEIEATVRSRGLQELMERNRRVQKSAEDDHKRTHKHQGSTNHFVFVSHICKRLGIVPFPWRRRWSQDGLASPMASGGYEKGYHVDKRRGNRLYHHRHYHHLNHLYHHNRMVKCGIVRIYVIVMAIYDVCFLLLSCFVFLRISFIPPCRCRIDERGNPPPCASEYPRQE